MALSLRLRTMALAYYYYLLALYADEEERKIRRRQIRDAANVFEVPDEEFQKTFCVNKDVALYLCKELRSDLESHRRDGLPPFQYKVLASLQLLFGGGQQGLAGEDDNVSIAHTTVSKYLHQFTKAVHCRLLPKWIWFPGSRHHREEIADGFLDKFGLPNVLGAVDCTHINILPSYALGLEYVNRWGKQSLNVQLIADSNARIISVNAKYPGWSEDQFIFDNSNVATELKRLHDNGIGDYYVLGDSDYSLQPWMMTPILKTQPDTPEDRYTKWHSRVRSVVERTEGHLKGTLKCLGSDRVLHYAPEKSAEIVYACCTLYNIMKHYNVPLDTIAAEAHEDPNKVSDIPEVQIYKTAQGKRNGLIQTFFT